MASQIELFNSVEGVIQWKACNFFTLSGSKLNTGRARLIRNDSSARFSFELSGNSNYMIHCNSNYVQNFELEINSI